MCLLDTEAHAHIIAMPYIPRYLHFYIESTSPTTFTLAIKDAIIILGYTYLYVTIGDLQKKSKYPIADIVEVDILLGAELINRYILGILPDELRVFKQSS